MSINAVSNTSQLSAIQSSYQQLRSEFTQLGQDLTSGNLAQAQTDFVTLSQAAASQFGNNSAVSKTLNTIGQALQSGNLTAAQQAYGTLPPGLISPNAVSHHSHAHHGAGGFQQLLNQLGQALQSGNLPAAQQAFATLQESLPGTGTLGTGSTGSATNGALSALSINA